MRKLIIPILTPYDQGQFDNQSMQRLIESVDPYVDMYAPCMSTGEGGLLNDSQWVEVVSAVIANTDKPVFAGVLNKADKIYEYIDRSVSLGCKGIIVPLGSYDKTDIEKIISYSDSKGLEIIFYNTEDNPVLDTNYISDICSFSNVVGFKDSSTNKGFMKSLIELKVANKTWDLYQGMEQDINADDNVDGYLISLANVEPELCSQLKSNIGNFSWESLQEAIKINKLDSESWYLSLKSSLLNREIIRSAEPVTKNYGL